MARCFADTVRVVHGFPLVIRAPSGDVAEVDAVTLGRIGDGGHHLGVAEYSANKDDEDDENQLQTNYKECQSIASGGHGEFKGPWTISNTQGLITQNHHGNEGTSRIHAYRGKIIQ